ncbi:hypothetical protein Trydic_g498 [Trypoxylus dichotomus]
MATPFEVEYLEQNSKAHSKDSKDRGRLARLEEHKIVVSENVDSDTRTTSINFWIGTSLSMTTSPGLQISGFGSPLHMLLEFVEVLLGPFLPELFGQTLNILPSR